MEGSMQGSSSFEPPAKLITYMRECRKDRISELPDAILHIIMSSLTVKEAACTMILSPRWRHLWASMPYLSFNFPKRGAKSQFEKLANFVEHVLLLRDGSGLDTFCISWYIYVANSRAESWIRYALKCNVQDLTIRGSHELCTTLPSSLFNGQSLKVLRIRFSGRNYSSFRIPFNLASLKELHLKGINLRNVSFEKIISGCPLLEILHIKKCDCTDILIQTEVLRTLHVASNYVPGLFLVCASNLVSFNYKTTVTFGREELALILPSLLDAAIDFEYKCDRNVSKILKGLYNARDLTISGNTIQVLSQEPDLSTILPALPNLKNLIVMVKVQRDIFQALVCLLQCIPNLETLRVENIAVPRKKRKGCWKSRNLSCELLHLKIVEIRCFGGTKNEHKFVKFVEANAKSLRHMVITPFSKV